MGGASNPRLRTGKVLAIDPTINEGTHVVESFPDGWTLVSNDEKLSAHWEHTVATLSNGPQGSYAGLDPPRL